MAANQMTQQAYEKLCRQRHGLIERDLLEARARLVAIQEGGGDAEGLEGVEAVFETERIVAQIARVERLIADAVIVDGGNRETVEAGCTMVLEFGDGPERYVYEEVTGPSTVSPSSPLGQAVAGRRAGEQVQVDAPGGTYQVQILAIE
jgi:transcription elongation factor GreA